MGNFTDKRDAIGGAQEHLQGIRFDAATMQALMALHRGDAKTTALMEDIREFNISQYDVNGDGVYDKAELEKMIVAMATKSIIEGVQEFGAIEAFAAPKEFFAYRKAEPGEVVETYTQSCIFETSQVAKEGDVVISRCNADGSLILNADGKPNSWIPSNFEQTYNLAEGRDVGNGYTVVVKNPARRLFVQIPETINIETSWGSMTVEAGSVLRFDEGTGKVYGIATHEFLEGHTVAPMTRDMIIQYDTLVDMLEKNQTNLTGILQHLDAGTAVLEDGVTFVKQDGPSSDTKDSIAIPIGDNIGDDNIGDDDGCI